MQNGGFGPRFLLGSAFVFGDLKTMGYLRIRYNFFTRKRPISPLIRKKRERIAARKVISHRLQRCDQHLNLFASKKQVHGLPFFLDDFRIPNFN